MLILLGDRQSRIRTVLVLLSRAREEAVLTFWSRQAARIGTRVTLDNYKVVLYRNQPDGWVAEVPAISGCYALMPTREEALAELSRVFEMIAAEYRFAEPRPGGAV